FPSRDQAGLRALNSPCVTRVMVPVATHTIQMSVVRNALPLVDEKAMKRPSGDQDGAASQVVPFVIGTESPPVGAITLKWALRPSTWLNAIREPSGDQSGLTYGPCASSRSVPSRTLRMCRPYDAKYTRRVPSGDHEGA